MKSAIETTLTVPYFRPSIADSEIAAVVECLQSGWLTTGPRAAEFERQFADHVGATHAVALNSCTAALHLAVEALGLRAGQAVLVPTMTFAATAEIVRYQGAVPVLVDCHRETQLLDLVDAERKLAAARAGEYSGGEKLEVVGVIPVHVGGLMVDVHQVQAFAKRHGLWIVEDAAHAFPAAILGHEKESGWLRCGEGTADVTCFSFYANKTITTGEGGMAVTNHPLIADRIRQMSLHGLSRDAWHRNQGINGWDYRIVAPGYKYNLTDIAACIGLHQLQRAESLRGKRQSIANYYRAELDRLDAVELPPDPPNRLHAWHLFPLRLRREALAVNRDEFLAALHDRGVNCSVHWRPLHLHPYYRDNSPWTSAQLPVASQVWETLVSLPIFPGMREEEQEYVVHVVREQCQVLSRHHARTRPRPR